MMVSVDRIRLTALRVYMGLIIEGGDNLLLPPFTCFIARDEGFPSYFNTRSLWKAEVCTLREVTK